MKLYIYTDDAEKVLNGDFGWTLRLTDRDDLESWSDNILLKSIDIDLELDKAHLTKMTVSNIEKEREAIKAELSQKMQKLDDRKASLLAIEHKAA